MADTVKELKHLVIEIWTKHRHKRTDEIININSAVHSSIEVLAKIDGRVKKKEMDPESALRLKRAILNSTLNLFKEGALPADIPYIEIVDNRELLNAFTSPRLISGPADFEDESPSISVPSNDSPKPQKKLTKPKKRSVQNRPTAPA